MGRTNEVTRRQLSVRGLNPCLSSSLNFDIQVKEYFHQVGSLTFCGEAVLLISVMMSTFTKINNKFIFIH